MARHGRISIAVAVTVADVVRTTKACMNKALRLARLVLTQVQVATGIGGATIAGFWEHVQWAAGVGWVGGLATLGTGHGRVLAVTDKEVMATHGGGAR